LTVTEAAQRHGVTRLGLQMDYDRAKVEKDADTINVKRITRRAATGG